MLTVLDPGPSALVVDAGRPGYGHLGVPPSGALDGPALALANRLVGNPAGAAGLELLLGGVRLRADEPCVVAVTGPPVGLAVDGRAVGSHRPVTVPVGATLTVSPLVGGLRAYLAVAGGVAVAAELGSRSADVLSGLGPAPLAAGDTVPVGPDRGPVPAVDGLVPVSVVPATVEVRVRLGPRDDWFADPVADLAAPWTVDGRSNRVGLRLAGPGLRRRPEREGAELPSEPILTGAVQVPPEGAPVVFLADHPTTGGYPVVGVVEPADLAVLAQCRPGSGVRIRAG